jgi:hypothetical protein
MDARAFLLSGRRQPRANDNLFESQQLQNLAGYDGRCPTSDAKFKHEQKQRNEKTDTSVEMPTMQYVMTAQNEFGDEEVLAEFERVGQRMAEGIATRSRAR